MYKVNRNLLRKIVREIIDEELDERQAWKDLEPDYPNPEEELDETSITASSPGYQSPYAFQGGEEANKQKRKKVAGQAGMTTIDRDPDPKRGDLY